MRPSISKNLLTLIIAGFTALLFPSCNKNNAAPPVTSSTTDSLPTGIIDSSAGCALYPGVPVKFSPSSTNVPAGITFTWSFGDGDTSSGMFATHAYSVGGTYTVTISFNNSIVPALSRTVYVTPITGSHYTQLMGGMRSWVGNASGNNGVFPRIGSVDSTFAVQVVDSGIVTFLYADAPMYISYIDTVTKNFITYRDCSGLRSLTYYYLRDSMSYYYNAWTQGTVGEDYPQLSLHTQ